jgi:hypothetical protein
MQHVTGDRDLRAVKLIFGPFGRVIRIDPDALDSALFRGHCTSSSKSHDDPRHAGSRPPNQAHAEKTVGLVSWLTIVLPIILEC